MPALSAEALALLEGYAWPGNIRELRNIVERAALLATGGTITAAQLPLERLRAPTIVAPPPPAPSAPAAPSEAAPRTGSLAQSIKREVENIEKQRILDALEQCAGNQTHAAKLLGISRATLLGRLDLYGIQRPRKPRA